MEGRHGPIRSIAYSPDGARLGISYDNPEVEIWTMHDDRQISIESLSGHTRCVRSLAWSPDGARLASGSDDYSIRIWDMRPKEPAQGPSSMKSPKNKLRHRPSWLPKPGGHIRESRSDT
ncbi:hypothetical protein FRC08_017212 [Ceratobasidium sp. 394]|nr:hypothetical protein FRC08_017212 [Ceratobasidium sp. 394]